MKQADQLKYWSSFAGNIINTRGDDQMKKDSLTFKAADGIDVFTYQWLPDDVSAVKGAVQISHGMAEHAARYERFAEALTKAGYAVYANDHRGHG